MNAPTLRAERAKLLELRANGVPNGTLRVLLSEAIPGGHDQVMLNFATCEPDVAELARAIIDKRVALIDAILRDEEMPPLSMT